MQRMPKFISHCRFIQENTADSSDDDIRVQHRFAELLMSRSLAGLLRLCILCMRNRKDIYNPPREAHRALWVPFMGSSSPYITLITVTWSLSKMNKNPTVSVVMATYNGEKYIREQIDSILGQSYPVYELVIQDDCSTDSTLAIAEDYARRYPNVKRL